MTPPPGTTTRRRRAALAALCSLALASSAAACASDDGASAPSTTARAATFGSGGSGEVSSGTTAPVTPAGIGEGVAPEVRGRTPLRGFGEVAATITAADGSTCDVCLLAATTSAQRARGLMEVTDPDLGGYDGMLFEFADPVDGGFWMRNTPMALSIAYFDAERVLVSTADMEPCADSTGCPKYPAERPFSYALEVPQGRLDDVAVVGRATIELTATRCPLATS